SHLARLNFLGRSPGEFTTVGKFGFNALVSDLVFKLSSVKLLTNNGVKSIQVGALALAKVESDGLSTIVLPSNGDGLANLNLLTGRRVDEGVESSKGNLGEAESGNGDDGLGEEHFDNIKNRSFFVKSK